MANVVSRCLNQVPIRGVNSALSHQHMLPLSPDDSDFLCAEQDTHKGCHWMGFKDRLRVDMSDEEALEVRNEFGDALRSAGVRIAPRAEQVRTTRHSVHDP